MHGMRSALAYAPAFVSGCTTLAESGGAHLREISVCVYAHASSVREYSASVVCTAYIQQSLDSSLNEACWRSRFIDFDGIVAT